MSFVNHMQQAISRALTNLGSTRLGLVSSSNPADSTIKVLIQPENVEIGPVNYATPWIGWFSPPTPGQQCIVLFQEGSKDVPIGALMLYYGTDIPPNAVAGEAIMQHSTGSFIKLANDGSISIVTAKSGAPVNITTAGNLALNVTGDLDAMVTGALNATVTGNIVATTHANASLTAERLP
jgi:phage gp45-like